MLTATNQKPQKSLKGDITHYHIAWKSTWCWVISPFNDFCGFWSWILDFCSAVRGQWSSSCQNSSKSVNRLHRYGDLTDFAKWRPSAILDLSDAYWDHPQWPLGGLYRRAKFGWSLCCSFDYMKLVIYRQFGLKKPIHAPKNCVSGNFTPKMVSNINETPKRHTLARVRVVWAVKRENPSTGLTCRWVPEKMYKYRNFVIFHPFAQKLPMGGFATNLAQP